MKRLIGESESHLNGCSRLFTARKRSLEQGNVFTPVCHSVHRGRGWLPSMHHRLHDRGVCLQGVCIQGGLGRPPPPGLPLGGGKAPMRYMEYYGIWSTSGRYASSWNAFLFYECRLSSGDIKTLLPSII